MSKSTNDKIDEIFTKLEFVEVDKSGNNVYRESKPFVSQITACKQLIKETLQECIGEEEPVNMSFNRTEDQIIRDTCFTQGRNELRQEALNKLDELLDEE